MRSAVIAFAAVFAVGALALALVGLSRHSSRVYTLGVNPATTAVELRHGDRACQAPVRPPRGVAFDRVGFLVGTFEKPGSEMRVEVLDDSSGRRLGAGTLPAGYADLKSNTDQHLVAVGRIQTSAPLRLCLENEGRRRVAVVGQDGIASPTTAATLNDQPIANDLTFDLHAGDTSMLASLPEFADRASRFRAGWITPLAYLVLALGIVAVAPLLLARGIARAAAADQAGD